jgi:hypothetical protein
MTPYKIISGIPEFKEKLSMFFVMKYPRKPVTIAVKTSFIAFFRDRAFFSALSFPAAAASAASSSGDFFGVCGSGEGKPSELFGTVRVPLVVAVACLSDTSFVVVLRRPSAAVPVDDGRREFLDALEPQRDTAGFRSFSVVLIL